MNADEFAQRLNACAELYENGDSLKCKLRSPEIVERESDPICDFVARYCVTDLELGLVCFLDRIQLLHGKIWFGNAEADPLVINVDTGRVEVLDHACVDYVMAPCAASSGMFLEAMATGIHSACIEYSEWTDGLEQIVRAAGGDEYRAFYAGILGWDVID